MRKQDMDVIKICVKLFYYIYSTMKYSVICRCIKKNQINNNCMFRKYEYRGVIFGCALFNIYTWKLAVKHCLLILAQLL